MEGEIMKNSSKDNCPLCGNEVECSTDEVGKLVTIAKKCSCCRTFDLIIKIMGFTFLIAAIIFPLTLCSVGLALNKTKLLSIDGLLFDISGVVFLFGNLEKSILAAAVLGDQELRRELPIHVRYTRFGLLLVVIGFVLQFLSTCIG
jgi:hypothetical protein